MVTPILFSVLIPAIYERLDSLRTLAAELEAQACRYPAHGVEIVSVVDNRAVSIGAKRDAVLRASHGKYVAYVDDDDKVKPDYITEILYAIERHGDVDVITFNQHAYIDSDTPALVQMQLDNENESHNAVAYKRAAWHTCAWRAELAKQFQFPDTSYGEDWAWVKQCNAAAETSYHIDKVLHEYRFNSKLSRAAN